MKRILIVLLLIKGFASAAEVLNIDNGNVTIIQDEGTELYFKVENITKMYFYLDYGKPKFNVSLLKEREDIAIQRKENFLKLKDAFFNKR